ncbi:MAG TPA: hypothetical protein VNJ10_03150 [Sphingomonas sp.]|nr:hypothetical protein [Sphingomonas sp.]
MLLVILIRLAALQIAFIAEPSDILASRAVAGKSEYANIFRTVRYFEESDERANLLPEATLENLNVPPSHPDRRRLFRNVPGSGVIVENHIVRMTLARISANRATVDARKWTIVYYYNANGDRITEKPVNIFDRLELVRENGRWLIQSVARRIR